jgi:hypothetical protein
VVAKKPAKKQANPDIENGAKKAPRPGNGGTIPPAKHQFKPGWEGGTGRPKGVRNWATILREIGDKTVPAEIQAILKAGGKNATYREAAAIIAYNRALLMDAVGNSAFEKIANREDGMPQSDLTSGGKPISGVVVIGPKELEDV